MDGGASRHPRMNGGANQYFTDPGKHSHSSKQLFGTAAVDRTAVRVTAAWAHAECMRRT